MEYVRGTRITEFCTARNLSTRDKLTLFLKVCSSVHFAHQKRIVHRDIKAGNILVTPEGEPKLLDFGIAKIVATDDEPIDLTLTVERRYTAISASPEQARGEPVTPAADIYALGALLYELLTGASPHRFESRRPSAEEMTRVICEREPERPSAVTSSKDSRAELRGDIDKIVLLALRKEPAQRYASAADFAADIQRHLDRKPVHARPRTVGYVARRFVQRNRHKIALAAGIIVLLAPALFVLEQRSTPSAQPISPNAKSVAVLPFEVAADAGDALKNMHASVISELGHVADLKVISRTSVGNYPATAARNLPAIGRALDVAHVLQGNIRRAGERLRVNAQLFDARTSKQLWKRQFERPVGELLLLQSDIAQAIAQQLQAQMSAEQQAALTQPPTSDVAAYELWLRGRELVVNSRVNQLRENGPRGIELLEQAISRDPKFARAYCDLALAHDTLYWFDIDHTPARREMAERAVAELERLHPDAGETHLARGTHAYYGYRDYDRARASLALARRALPNEPSVVYLLGLIDRRQGRWEESAEALEQAIELDPRSRDILRQLALTYNKLHAYRKVEALCDRILEVDPNDSHFRANKAAVAFYESAEF
ncbi:MAG TPA: protein kinase, partial [Chthoniobacterales bacterium]